MTERALYFVSFLLIAIALIYLAGHFALAWW
jgi:hypothetical protein